MDENEIVRLLARVHEYFQENSGHNIKQNAYRKLLMDEITDAMTKIIEAHEGNSITDLYYLMGQIAGLLVHEPVLEDLVARGFSEEKIAELKQLLREIHTASWKDL